MKKHLHSLIADVLLYTKELQPSHPTFMGSKEECAAFSSPPPSLPPQAQTATPPTPFIPPSPPPLPPKTQTVAPLTQLSSPPVVRCAPPNPQVPSLSPSIKETLARLSPHLKLTDHIPDDSEGKKRENAWREKTGDAAVVLLACRQDENTLDFLKTLAKAIDQHLAKTKIVPVERIEKENHWDLFLQKNPLRLIVASEGLFQHKNLLRFYKQDVNLNTHSLEKTPLLILSSADHYKQLDKKAALWKMLCQILKT